MVTGLLAIMSSPRTIIRTGFMLLLFGWGIWGGFHSEAFLPLHGVDLLIHEVGHPLFSLFGSEVLTALGGTLLQLALPVAFTLSFVLRRDYYAASATGFWTAQNLFDIAVYMRDARALALPLIGIGDGDGGNPHDWNFLFSTWGVLAHDIVIARGVALAGWVLLFGAIGAGLYTADLPAVPVPEPEGDPAA